MHNNTSQWEIGVGKGIWKWNDYILQMPGGKDLGYYYVATTPTMDGNFQIGEKKKISISSFYGCIVFHGAGGYYPK